MSGDIPGEVTEAEVDPTFYLFQARIAASVLGSELVEGLFDNAVLVQLTSPEPSTTLQIMLDRFPKYENLYHSPDSDGKIENPIDAHNKGVIVGLNLVANGFLDALSDEDDVEVSRASPAYYLGFALGSLDLEAADQIAADIQKPVEDDTSSEFAKGVSKVAITVLGSFTANLLHIAESKYLGDAPPLPENGRILIGALKGVSWRKLPRVIAEASDGQVTEEEAEIKIERLIQAGLVDEHARDGSIINAANEKSFPRTARTSSKGIDYLRRQLSDLREVGVQEAAEDADMEKRRQVPATTGLQIRNALMDFKNGDVFERRIRRIPREDYRRVYGEGSTRIEVRDPNDRTTWGEVVTASARTIYEHKSDGYSRKLDVKLKKGQERHGTNRPISHVVYEGKVSGDKDVSWDLQFVDGVSHDGASEARMTLNYTSSDHNLEHVSLDPTDEQGKKWLDLIGADMLNIVGDITDLFPKR